MLSESSLAVTGTIRVHAPSRIHFGLFAFGRSSGRQFGGVGVMVDRPGLALRLTPAKSFSANGRLAERIVEFVDRWTVWHSMSGRPGCAIELESAPRLHVGLGVGTQLGLAVATGLNMMAGRRSSAAQLAASVGRGLRSAVGTLGFLQGGLIAEEGKLPGEVLSPICGRVVVPAAWRFVLISPRASVGLHGRREQRAFERLPPVPVAVTATLIREAKQALLPAARQQRFDAFSESVYRFGRLAGGCFSAIQGGPYNGQHLQRLVERLRAAGIQGVGQTSWGPTIFAMTPTQSAADDLVGRLRNWGDLTDAEIVVTAANNSGVHVEDLSG